MSKLIMLKGLPASGKSTWAKQFVVENDDWKRVNKDDLRRMIDGGHWSKHNEENIVSARDVLVRKWLNDGFNVIVDDTNYHPSHEEVLKGIADEYKADFEVKHFDTNPRICMERDATRGEDRVGNKVIMDMYFKYAHPKEPEYSDDKQNAFICDIDGTLAIMGARSPFDWSKVGIDTVNHNISMIIRTLRMSSGLPMILVSGRDEACRAETEKWLVENSVPYHELIMRKAGDMRKDVEVKREIYDGQIKHRYNVIAVFDDRDQVVDMWRSLGMICLQVNYGSF